MTPPELLNSQPHGAGVIGSSAWLGLWVFGVVFLIGVITTGFIVEYLIGQGLKALMAFRRLVMTFICAALNPDAVRSSAWLGTDIQTTGDLVGWIIVIGVIVVAGCAVGWLI